jgi:hypothetical protein
LRRAALVGVLACAVALPAAAASSADRVQVGRPGQNATEGFPLTLFATVALLPDYAAVNRFDGHSRRWQGPDYRSANLGGGKSTLDWSVTFDRVGSAGAMATKALGGAPWPVAERPRVNIPHRVGGRTVGSIPAAAVLTKAPGQNNAQFESVVAFPLCRGVFAAAKFSLTSPGSEYGTDPSDTYLVKGVAALQWNHDRAIAALGQVVLDGHLPPGRVTARSAGRSITGAVRDCRGDAMAGIAVRLLRGTATVARGRAGTGGSYRLRAPGPGTYRVAAGLTVSGNASRPNREDVRTATVTVR